MSNKLVAFCGSIYDNNLMRLSPFQLKRSADVAKLPGFKQYVVEVRAPGSKPQSREEGPCSLIYYIGDTLMIERLGVNRLIAGLECANKSDGPVKKFGPDYPAHLLIPDQQ